MKFKISNASIILSWAITTFVGWIITSLGYTIPLFPSTVVLIWGGLMTIPVTLTAFKYAKSDSNKLFDAWALTTIIILVQNYFVSRLQVFSYYTLWMIGVAAVYYYTYEKIPPLSKRAYFYGSLLNAAAIPLVYILPLQYFALLAGFIQAGPVFYDWVMVHR